jgi:hypothetical protein
MKSWIEALNPLQQLMRTLGNFFLCPQSHLYRLGEVPSIRILLLDPSSQPVIVNDPN